MLNNGGGLKVEIRGDSFDQLIALSKQAEAVIETVDGVADVESNLAELQPQEHLQPDRAQLADYGVAVTDVSNLLELAVNGRRVGDYRPDGDSIPIRIQYHDSKHLSLETLLQQEVVNDDRVPIPLQQFVTVEPGSGPAHITRRDQQRTITLDVNISGRDEGSVAQDIATALQAIPHPITYSLRLAGNYEEQQRSSRELQLGFILSLVLVYMVLACQYESLRDPLIVMFSVPVAAIGVVITLFITDSTMNMQSGIGCIMLGGIVVNNAILLVDQTGRLRQSGQALSDAIREAGRRRLRPILMTSITTILGLLPLALGIGEGADAQAPLARAVVGGLIASTFISLLLVPAIYQLFYRTRDNNIFPHQT